MTFGSRCQSIQFLVFQGRCNIDWCALYWCRQRSSFKNSLCFLFFSGWKVTSNSVSKSNLSLHSLSGSGSTTSPKVAGIFQSADVFLLCYRISDPASLFSAINFWCPEIRCYAPTTPIILVGCQSDLRWVTFYQMQFDGKILWTLEIVFPTKTIIGSRCIYACQA